MGNTCFKNINNLYYKLPVTEKCPYCKKNRYISKRETAFVITTRGCRICRLRMKYFVKRNHYNEVTVTRVSF